jgi:hypothetical protein
MKPQLRTVAGIREKPIPRGKPLTRTFAIEPGGRSRGNPIVAKLRGKRKNVCTVLCANSAIFALFPAAHC